MLPRFPSAQRGQAIVVVALVLVALLLGLALAVDGGNLYVHRRMAQNASDAAALQGAAAMLAPGASEDQILAVMTRLARENGIAPGEDGAELHAWFVDATGQRL